MAPRGNYENLMSAGKYDLRFAYNTEELIQLRDLFNQIIERADKLGNTRVGLSKDSVNSMRSYVDYITQANKQHKLASQTVAQINTELKKLQGNANIFKMFGELKNNQKYFAQNIRDFNTGFLQLEKGINFTVDGLQKVDTIVDHFTKTLFNSANWTLATTGVHAIIEGFAHAQRYVSQIDKSLNNIQIVTKKVSNQMAAFTKDATIAAQRLGTTTNEFAKASLIFYQQGLNDTAAQKRAETVIKTANVTKQAVSEVSEQLTALWNGYNVAENQLESYVDKLAAVAANSASNLEEISVAMSKVASTANMLGVNIDQLTAQMGTIISTTRQAPEAVGTALRTIYARMLDLKQDGTDEFGVSLGQVSGQLQTVGIDILDVNGNLKNLGQVIDELSKKWNTWSAAQKQAIAIAVGGKRQYNNIIALFENQDQYQALLKTSQNATGELQQQQDIFLESYEAKLKKIQSSWESIINTVKNDTAFKSILDVVNGVLKGVSSIQKSGILGSAMWMPLGKLITTFREPIKEQILNVRRNIANRQLYEEYFSSYDDIVDNGQYTRQKITNSKRLQQLFKNQDFENKEFDDLFNYASQAYIQNLRRILVKNHDLLGEQTYERFSNIFSKQSDKIFEMFDNIRDSYGVQLGNFAAYKNDPGYGEFAINYEDTINNAQQALEKLGRNFLEYPEDLNLYNKNAIEYQKALEKLQIAEEQYWEQQQNNVQNSNQQQQNNTNTKQNNPNLKQSSIAFPTTLDVKVLNPTTLIDSKIINTEAEAIPVYIVDKGSGTTPTLATTPDTVPPARTPEEISRLYLDKAINNHVEDVQYYEKLNPLIYAAKHNGDIRSGHGIGQLTKEELKNFKYAIRTLTIDNNVLGKNNKLIAVDKAGRFSFTDIAKCFYENKQPAPSLVREVLPSLLGDNEKPFFNTEAYNKLTDANQKSTARKQILLLASAIYGSDKIKQALNDLNFTGKPLDALEKGNTWQKILDHEAFRSENGKINITALSNSLKGGRRFLTKRGEDFFETGILDDAKEFAEKYYDNHILQTKENTANTEENNTEIKKSTESKKKNKKAIDENTAAIEEETTQIKSTKRKKKLTYAEELQDTIQVAEQEDDTFAPVKKKNKKQKIAFNSKAEEDAWVKKILEEQYYNSFNSYATGGQLDNKGLSIHSLPSSVLSPGDPDRYLVQARVADGEVLQVIPKKDVGKLPGYKNGNYDPHADQMNDWYYLENSPTIAEVIEQEKEHTRRIRRRYKAEEEIKEQQRSQNIQDQIRYEKSEKERKQRLLEKENIEREYKEGEPKDWFQYLYQRGEQDQIDDNHRYTIYDYFRAIENTLNYPSLKDVLQYERETGHKFNYGYIQGSSYRDYTMLSHDKLFDNWKIEQENKITDILNEKEQSISNYIKNIENNLKDKRFGLFGKLLDKFSPKYRNIEDVIEELYPKKQRRRQNIDTIALDSAKSYLIDKYGLPIMNVGGVLTNRGIKSLPAYSKGLPDWQIEKASIPNGLYGDPYFDGSKTIQDLLDRFSYKGHAKQKLTMDEYDYFITNLANTPFGYSIWQSIMNTPIHSNKKMRAQGRTTGEIIELNRFLNDYTPDTPFHESIHVLVSKIGNWFRETDFVNNNKDIIQNFLLKKGRLRSHKINEALNQNIKDKEFYKAIELFQTGHNILQFNGLSKKMGYDPKNYIELAKKKYNFTDYKAKKSLLGHRKINEALAWMGSSGQFDLMQQVYPELYNLLIEIVKKTYGFTNGGAIDNKNIVTGPGSYDNGKIQLSQIPNGVLNPGDPDRYLLQARVADGEELRVISKKDVRQLRGYSDGTDNAFNTSVFMNLNQMLSNINTEAAKTKVASDKFDRFADVIQSISNKMYFFQSTLGTVDQLFKTLTGDQQGGIVSLLTTLGLLKNSFSSLNRQVEKQKQLYWQDKEVPKEVKLRTKEILDAAGLKGKERRKSINEARNIAKEEYFLDDTLKQQWKPYVDFFKNIGNVFKGTEDSNITKAGAAVKSIGTVLKGSALTSLKKFAVALGPQGFLLGGISAINFALDKWHEHNVKLFKEQSEYNQILVNQQQILNQIVDTSYDLNIQYKKGLISMEQYQKGLLEASKQYDDVSLTYAATVGDIQQYNHRLQQLDEENRQRLSNSTDMMVDLSIGAEGFKNRVVDWWAGLWNDLINNKGYSSTEQNKAQKILSQYGIENLNNLTNEKYLKENTNAILAVKALMSSGVNFNKDDTLYNIRDFYQRHQDGIFNTQVVDTIQANKDAELYNKLKQAEIRSNHTYTEEEINELYADDIKSEKITQWDLNKVLLNQAQKTNNKHLAAKVSALNNLMSLGYKFKQSELDNKTTEELSAIASATSLGGAKTIQEFLDNPATQLQIKHDQLRATKNLYWGDERIRGTNTTEVLKAISESGLDDDDDTQKKLANIFLRKGSNDFITAIEELIRTQTAKAHDELKIEGKYTENITKFLEETAQNEQVVNYENNGISTREELAKIGILNAAIDTEEDENHRKQLEVLLEETKAKINDKDPLGIAGEHASKTYTATEVYKKYAGVEATEKDKTDLAVMANELLNEKYISSLNLVNGSLKNLTQAHEAWNKSLTKTLTQLKNTVQAQEDLRNIMNDFNDDSIITIDNFEKLTQIIANDKTGEVLKNMSIDESGKMIMNEAGFKALKDNQFTAIRDRAIRTALTTGIDFDARRESETMKQTTEYFKNNAQQIQNQGIIYAMTDINNSKTNRKFLAESFTQQMADTIIKNRISKGEKISAEEAQKYSESLLSQMSDPEKIDKLIEADSSQKIYEFLVNDLKIGDENKEAITSEQIEELSKDTGKIVVLQASTDRVQSAQDQQRKNQAYGAQYNINWYADIDKKLNSINNSMQMTQLAMTEQHGRGLIQGLAQQNQLLEQTNAARRERMAISKARMDNAEAVLGGKTLVQAQQELQQMAINGQQNTQQYIEMQGAIQAAQDAQQQYYSDMQDYVKNLHQMVQNNLAAMTAQLEEIKGVSEAQVKQNSDWLKINQDFRQQYQNQTTIANTALQNYRSYMPTTNNSIGQAKIYAELANRADLYDTQTKMLTEAGAARVKELGALYNIEVGDGNIVHNQNDAVQKSNEAQGIMTDNILKQQEFYNQTYQAFLQTISDYDTKVQQITQHLNVQNTKLSLQKTILAQLQGTGQKYYSTMDEMYNVQTRMNDTLISNYQYQLQTYEDLLDSTEEGTQEYYQLLQKIDQIQEQIYNTTQQQIQNIQDKFNNAIDGIVDKYEEFLNQSQLNTDTLSKQLEADQKAADVYYDNLERIYELQSLNNKITKELTKNLYNTKGQRQLMLFQEEVNKYAEDHTEMTKTDVDYLNKRLEITKAEIALQEAQAAKNSMKLVRDTSGNWTYNYIADPNQVIDAQQTLLDQGNELYQWLQEQKDQGESSVFSARKTLLDSLGSIFKSQLGDDEKQRQAETARQNYITELQKALSQINVANNSMPQVGSTLASYLDKYAPNLHSELVESYKEIINMINQAGSMSMTEVFKQFENNEDLSGLGLNTINNTIQDWLTEVNQANVDDINLENSIASTTNVINELMNEVTLMKESINSYRDITDVTIISARDLNTNFNETISTINDFDDKMVDIIENFVHNFNETLDIVKQTESEFNALTLTAGWVRTEIQHFPQDLGEMLVDVDATLEQQYYDLMKGFTDKILAYIEENKKPNDEVDNKVERQTQDNVPLVAGYHWETNQNGKRVAVQNGHVLDPLQDLINHTPTYFTPNTPKFDTGGYTGEWGSEGRLALLHEKEIVLNAEDTKNILDAIKLNNSIFNNISNIPTAHPILTPDTSAAQNNTYNITAEFPNANDVTQIREAILSLPRLASQKVTV